MEKYKLREIIKTQIKENQLYDAHPITMLELRESLVEALHQALSMSGVVGRSEQFICYKADIGNSRCSSQCIECGENECSNK